MSVTNIQVGDLVDRRYRIQREIATGGMSRVFEAEHTQLGCRVAIKVPLPSEGHEEEPRLRLLREGQALARARHPGIVAALDAGIDPATQSAFLALEMIDGKSLDGLLAARGRVDVPTACAIMVQLSEALARCHGVGVVHRDVKPSNVLMWRDVGGVERPRLIDFGIAALGEWEGTPAAPKLTQAGERLGTVEYMAPEQLAGERVDRRADVWATGISLYELVTGEVPFHGARGAVIRAILTGARLPPTVGKIAGATAALDSVLARATARSAGDRFEDMIAMAAALRAAAGSPPPAGGLLPAAPRGGTDGRRHRRAAYSTPVRVVRGSGSIDGRTEDVSESGLLVILSGEVARDERVTVRFCLPSSGRAVAVPSVVRWAKSGRGAFATGIEFDGLTNEVGEDIRRFTDLVGVA